MTQICNVQIQKFKIYKKNHVKRAKLLGEEGQGGDAGGGGGKGAEGAGRVRQAGQGDREAGIRPPVIERF